MAVGSEGKTTRKRYQNIGHFCPQCNRDLEQGVMYCYKCGMDFELWPNQTEFVVSKQKDRFCPECNKRVKHDTMFCSECGTNLRFWPS